MKKVAIVYTSKFGHTKQYADWLAAHLGKDDADVINVASFNPTQLLAYKLIIFASCVYGDKMPIMDYVKKNIMGISTAKTMFLAVGWYTNDSEEAIQKLTEENYPDQFKGKVPMYVVNSGIDKKKISVADKAKLLASQVMIEKKDGRSTDDINILSIMKGYSDPTAEENLDSIKKGIEEYFNPTKKEEPKPVPKAEPVVKSEPAAPTPIPAPVEPAPKPMAASEMTSDADALSSLENAFKALKAPKPEPASAPAPAPKPVDASQMTSDEDALSSLENAFKALSAPKPKPEPVVEVKPEPVVEVKPEPVVEVKPVAAPAPKPTATQREVASSVKSAIKAMSNGSLNTSYTPAPAFEDINSEDVAGIGSIDMGFAVDEQPVVSEESAIPAFSSIDLTDNAGMSWDSVTKPAEEAKPEPVAEVKPEPVVVKPVRVEKPAQSEHVSSVDVLSEFDFISGTAKPEPVQSVAPAVSAVETTSAVDMDVYDFMDDNKPKASSRALNAVQDLAKAKAKAEAEAAKKAAEEAAAAAEEAARVHTVDNSFIEQMKKDMEVLAEESQHEIEIGSVSMTEEEDDEIDGFTFSNDIDYDLSEIEIDTPPIGEISLETIHKFDDGDTKERDADFDLRKLQEEINASIETNKANKERMMKRYDKKPKTETHNPFAVQFEEDESKSKKKKKGSEIGSKRLEDPLDPDVFFSRPTKKTPDWNMPSDTMPEIKFRK